MTIYTNKIGVLSNAISLPGDCITFIKASSDGNKYDIQISVEFDSKVIVDQQAFKARFYVQDTPREEIDPSINDLLKSDSITDVSYAKALILTNSVKEPTYLVDQLIDLTTSISNFSIGKPKIKTNIVFNPFVKEENNEIIVNQKVKPNDGQSKKSNYLFNKLLRSGVKDPTSFAKTTNNSRSPIMNSFLGLKSLSTTKHSTTFSQQLESNIFKSGLANKQLNGATSLSPSIETVVSSITRAYKNITVDKKAITSGNYYVYVDLLNNQNQVVQSVKSKFDVLNLIQYSLLPPSITPKIALTKISRSGGSDLFSIKVSTQKNSRNSVKLLLKGTESFQEILTLTGESKFLNIPIPLVNKTASIRAVYVDENGNESHEFENYTVHNNRLKTQEDFVTAVQNSDSVVVSAIIKNPRVVGIIFKVINLTLKQKTPTVLGKRSGFLSNQFNTESIVHLNPTPGQIYKYYVTCIYDDGLARDSRSDIIEIFQYGNTGITLTTTTPSVTSTDVTFNVNLTLNQTPTSYLISYLRSLGLDSQFNSNITDQLDQLTKIINFVAYRVNLENGDREFMGIITNNIFSDSIQSEIYPVQKFSSFVSYRYEIFPALTDVATTFENQNLIKKSNDLTSSVLKNYQKFKHPIVRQRSMLVTPRGLSTKFSKNPLEFTIIGKPVVVLVPRFSTDYIENISYNVDRIGGETAVELKWNLNKFGFQKIDHFIVSRIIEGRETIVGRCHAQFKDGVCRFIDKLHEFGNITYSIATVFSDYTIGSPNFIEMFVEQK